MLEEAERESAGTIAAAGHERERLVKELAYERRPHRES